MLDLLSKTFVVIGNTCFLLMATVAAMGAFWFITLPLCVFFIYCWHRQKAAPRSSSHTSALRSRRRSQKSQDSVTQRFFNLLLLAPFAITLSIAALGGNFQSSPDAHTYYYWVSDVVTALVWLHFPISGTAMMLTKQQGLFVVSLSVLQLWISCCAAFVSGMFITGQFL